MTDLTHHLTAAAQKQVGLLLLSDLAAAELRNFLSADAPSHSDPKKFGPIVAQSVAGFLTSGYFSRSTWFRSQTVHVSSACLITTGNEERLLTCHIVKSAEGHLITATFEHPLPEGYFERRLLEEVRVEHGIPEPTGRPLGRRRQTS